MDMALFGTLGILLGILLGFLFGALIHYLHSFVATEANNIIPLSLSTFLGMGAGAIAGGVIGGLTALKK